MNVYLRYRERTGAWVWRRILDGVLVIPLLINSGCVYSKILGIQPMSHSERDSVEQLPAPDAESFAAKKHAYPYDLVLLVRAPEGPFSERYLTGYEDATDMGQRHALSSTSSVLSYSLVECLTRTNLFRNVITEPQNTYFGRIGSPSPVEPDLVLTPSFDIYEARVHEVSESWMTGMGAHEIRKKATIEGEIKGLLSIRSANNTAFLDVPVAMKSGPTTAETRWQISGSGDKASRNPMKASEAHRAHREIVEKMVNMLVEALEAKESALLALSGPNPHPPGPQSPSLPNSGVGRRFAVLVGISRYQNASREFPNLDYADRDAKDLASFLLSSQGGSLPLNNIKLLVNQEATLQNVRSALCEFTRQADINDFVLIYFSGHGIPDPERVDTLYLMCYDSDRKHMPSTALPMSEVQTALQHHIIAQRVVVLADACHSAGISTEGKRGIDVNRVNRAILDLSQTKPTAAIFTSSEGYELSQEGRKWGGGHGVFTWALLEALQGKADGCLDSKPDGVVSLGELIEYTRQTVITETKNTQHPAPRGTYDRALPMSLLQVSPGPASP